MLVFRLSRAKYANQLNGKGAAKSGNRWNSKGTEIIYTAESRALAMAEVAVHLQLTNLPQDFVMLEIEIPENLVVGEIDTSDLDDNWSDNPPHLNSQKLGDLFIQSGATCILRVPSAIVPGDFNYLMNPHHPNFPSIYLHKIVKFPFDNRLLKG